MLSQDTVNNFIIEMTLITPIEKIIKNLRAGEFRDCDIKWLDSKMDAFITFAAKTLGIDSLNVDRNYGKGSILNDYNKKRYIDNFGTLLEYFKSFK